MTRERVAMVSQLTEALIEHATLVAAQCEGLISSLEATMQRLGAPSPEPQRQSTPRPVVGPSRGADPTPPQPAGSPRPSVTAYPAQPGPPAAAPPPPGENTGFPPYQAPAPEQQPNPAPSGAAGPPPPHPAETFDGVASDAYLRATRLALDGCGRAEIAARIRVEFGIADPEPVLNRVLGTA